MKTSKNPNLPSGAGIQLNDEFSKNFLCAGNDKGGVGKTTTAASVADGLQTLGFRLRLADGDATNETLQALLPDVEKVRYKSEDEMDRFIGSILESDNADIDLTILDLPGDSGETLADYFTPVRLEAFRQLGIRIIVGLTVIDDLDSITGATIWASTFRKRAEFISLANGKLTPFGTTFSLANLAGGGVIETLTQGRQIYVPRFSERMVQDYARVKAVPSAYLPGGAAYRSLGLNPISALPWQSQHNAVLRSVVAQAEWLTGRPAPKPIFSKPEGVEGVLSRQEEEAEREAFLRDFRAKIGRGASK